MPRHFKPTEEQSSQDWYLKEWMKQLGITQTELADRCGWTKGSMNDMYKGRTAYYRHIVNVIAAALEIEVWELFMPPERALRLRSLEAALQQIGGQASG